MGVIEIRSRGERLNNLGNVRNANLDTGADKVWSAVGRLGETVSRGGTALGREGIHLFAAMEEREYQRKANLAFASAAKWLRERFYGAPDDASGKHPAAIDDWMWGKDDAHPDALDRNPEEWASRQQRDYDHFETRLLTEEHEMSAKELERFKSSSRYQALLERYSALEADTVAKANHESERQGILGCYAETRDAAVAAVPGAEEDFLDALNSRLTFDKINDPALRQAQIRKEAEALAGDRLKLEIAAINAANLNATDPAEAEKAYQDLIKGIEDGSVRLLDEPLARAAYGEPPTPGAYGLRPDGTAKGSGFLGPQQLKDGKVATEYSVGVEIDGKEMEIPTLVPTLTAAERKEMLEDIIPNGKEPPKAIMDKAVAHAEKRLKAGKSVFAEPDEAENHPYSRLKSAAVSDLRTNLARIQTKIRANQEAERKAIRQWAEDSENAILDTVALPAPDDLADSTRYHLERSLAYGQILASPEAEKLKTSDPVKYRAFKKMAQSEEQSARRDAIRYTGRLFLVSIDDGSLTSAQIQATADELLDAGFLSRDDYDTAKRRKVKVLSEEAKILHQRIFGQKGNKFPNVVKWQENLMRGTGQFEIASTKEGAKAANSKMTLEDEDDKETLLYRQWVDAANYAIGYMEQTGCSVDKAFDVFKRLTFNLEKDIAHLSYDERLRRKQELLKAFGDIGGTSAESYAPEFKDRVNEIFMKGND